ncbi:MAG: ribonuclease Y [Candidatus Magasanikbacteria bacterium RIFOXYD2_FULL_39_9]|uniref:Ribonuclease Y n=1 Tax=Candidatus Magasanikbacteria bacterium RIFOXYD1_FULL_40_23 TaxID=1798705 RepID=A0A1F6P9R6_9BACT|nr:MAG: ribonuclease Y [Candidatus Magasanikbacteria bacterium RIFOXYD2_FULL_39_9]OGH92780.1 MAG: ribonuclease Y [Candidatus Magasanikbacteria bacterium RIFOXYD1_FULL_40_23]
MSNFIWAILVVAGAGLGTSVGYFLRKKLAQAQANSIEAKAESLLVEAKTKQQEIILQGKEKATQIVDEAKREEKTVRQDLHNAQERLERREALFDQKLIELEGSKQKLQEKADQIQHIKTEIEQMKEQEVEKLQQIATMKKEEAKEELLKRIEQQSKADLMARVLKLDKESIEVYEEKARELIADAVQRCASSHAAEITSTTVQLTSEDMKGRIIGKEGRNIKTIEKLTGCELIIDDTPDAIVVSGFSPIRRQIAKLALEKLMADGRIQPARIEEFVEKAKQDLAVDIKKAGEEALYKMGITGIDPKLVSIVGRLKYRTSYGQNIILHSMETGYLAGMIASELGLDAAKAKKCGFFHDIGKAVDQETQGSHPEIGHMILKKFNMDEDICQAALTHHQDKPYNIYSSIAKAADAISGARVGARKDSYEQFVARLEELEKTAKSFPGIDKVYAIQAGREVRVFVKPNEVDDYSAFQLAKDISRKIEQELQYPGEIRVTIIRETRVVEYAK